MKQGLIVRRGVSSNRFAFAVAMALVTVGISQTGCTSCGVAQSLTPTQRLEAALKRAEASKRAQAFSNASPGTSLGCPLLGSFVVSPPQPVNGGHRVTLSWTASAPADAKHSAAVGYCVYRTAVGDAQSGLINQTPFSGTSCTDDLVENGKRYSYVVRAVNAGYVPSITSNTAPVEIPATGASHPPVSGVSPPLCRGETPAK
jgi:hypothetical protein